MKLIPMTDFVLETLNSKDLMVTPLQKLNKHIKYAKFLKQPLTLGMFIPCDEDGNVLEIPVNYSRNVDSEISNKELQEKFDLEFFDYKKSKEKVLFYGFEIEYTKEENPVLFLYNNEIGCNVFLDKSFGVRHENIEDLIGLGLDCAVTF